MLNTGADELQQRRLHSRSANNRKVRLSVPLEHNLNQRTQLSVFGAHVRPLLTTVHHLLRETSSSLMHGIISNAGRAFHSQALSNATLSAT